MKGHYFPPFEDYYEESGPTPFADGEKGCSILITNGGLANFNKGLHTQGNVYLHGNSHLVSYNGCDIGGDVKLYDMSTFDIHALDPIPEGAPYQIAGNVELYGASLMSTSVDTTIKGNLSIESGHVLCGADDEYSSLTVGGNVSIGKDSSLEHGKNLTVTGDLVMQEGSTFDGFTGDVSAKNMQLYGDISFTGDNRHISTTENLQTDGGNLTFSGQGTAVSVGKNPEVKNGQLNLLNADGTVPTTAYNVVLNELAVAGNQNTMESNLIICDNAKLTFREGSLLTMGCDVTIGSGTDLNLEGDYQHSLVALFSGGDGLTLAGEAITHDGRYDAYGTIATLNGESIARGQYVISYNNGVVSFGAGSVPEPATTTLSLLALAALAARRKRK